MRQKDVHGHKPGLVGSGFFQQPFDLGQHILGLRLDASFPIVGDLTGNIDGIVEANGLTHPRAGLKPLKHTNSCRFESGDSLAHDEIGQEAHQAGKRDQQRDVDEQHRDERQHLTRNDFQPFA